MDTDNSQAECCCVDVFPESCSHVTAFCGETGCERYCAYALKSKSDRVYTLADLVCLVGILGRLPLGDAILLLERLEQQQNNLDRIVWEECSV